jgi:hypothetical protein
MQTIPAPTPTLNLPQQRRERSGISDPVVPNPGVPEVADPPGPALAPGPPQPEIQEPPPAPVEVPQPGIRRPEIPQR